MTSGPRAKCSARLWAPLRFLSQRNGLRSSSPIQQRGTHSRQRSRPGRECTWRDSYFAAALSCFVQAEAFRHSTAPSLNWYTTEYVTPGVPPAFGASCTLKLPLDDRATLLVPATTAYPSAVVNAGHEINSVPEAGVPSARYTVSLTVVNAGDCARAALTATRHVTPNKRAALGGWRATWFPPKSF